MFWPDHWLPFHSKASAYEMTRSHWSALKINIPMVHKQILIIRIKLLIKHSSKSIFSWSHEHTILNITSHKTISELIFLDIPKQCQLQMTAAYFAHSATKRGFSESRSHLVSTGRCGFLQQYCSIKAKKKKFSCTGPELPLLYET